VAQLAPRSVRDPGGRGAEAPLPRLPALARGRDGWIRGGAGVRVGAAARRPARGAGAELVSRPDDPRPLALGAAGPPRVPGGGPASAPRSPDGGPRARQPDPAAG